MMATQDILDAGLLALRLAMTGWYHYLHNYLSLASTPYNWRMKPMSIRIKELMETLSQAQEAQDAVPAMKAELARLSRALEASQNEANRYKQASEDIGVQLADTKSQVSKLGDERDEAMFHALELEEKLGSITKVMGSALGLVQPTPASEVKAAEPQPQEPPVPQLQAPQGWQAYDTQAGQDYKPVHSQDYDTWTKPQHDEERHPSAPEVASQPSPTEGSEVSPQPNGTVPASTPTSSSDPAPSTPEAGSSEHTAEVSPAPRPAYQGVRWQDKPGYLSWLSFIDQGGEKPYWMQ